MVHSRRLGYVVTPGKAPARFRKGRIAAIATVLKTADCNRSQGSSPCPSAICNALVVQSVRTLSDFGPVKVASSNLAEGRTLEGSTEQK